MAGEDDEDVQTVSTVLSEYLLVALIIFSLVSEVVLNRIELWAQNTRHHIFAVLRVLYRELMVLGIVSFSFVVYELTAEPSHETVLSFEFAHIFIFLLAVFYTIVVLCTLLLSSSLSSRWKSMERMDLADYLAVRDRYANMRRLVKRRPVTWWLPNILNIYKFARLHEVITFHDIRFQFIYFRDLPDNFRFASFLRKIKRTTFIELVELHWSLWVMFLTVVLIDILRRHLVHPEVLDEPGEEGTDRSWKIFKATMRAETSNEQIDEREEFFDSIFTICAALLLSVAVQVLAWKIRQVYWKLMKNPRTYYEGVESNAVMDDLQKLAKEDEDMRRRRRRKNRRLIVKPDRVESAVATGDEADVEGEEKRDEVDAQKSNSVVCFDHALSDGDTSPGVFASGGAVAMSKNVTHSLDQSVHVKSETSAMSTLHDNPAGHSLDAHHLSSAGAADQSARLGVARQDQKKSHQREHKHLLSGRRKRCSNDCRAGAFHQRDRLSERIRGGNSDVDGELRKSYDSRGSRLDSSSLSIDPAGTMNREQLSTYFSEDKNGSGVVGSSMDTGSSDRAPGGEELIRPVAESDGNVYIDVHGGVNRKGRGQDNSASSGIGQALGDEDTIEMGGAGPLKKQTTVINATILKNYEAHHNARKGTPRTYPRVLTRLIPRLSRVASPLEKLFWFGSHRFFFWCVEFVLFFSTVLLASSTARIALSAVKDVEIDAVHTAGMVMAAANLLFVLLRIAVIVKQYIFILHNASLIPEMVALETIERMHSKHEAGAEVVLDAGTGAMDVGVEKDEDEEENEGENGDEGEDEDEDEDEGENGKAGQNRLGRYFRSQAVIGEVTGIDGGPAVSEGAEVSVDVGSEGAFQVMRRRSRMGAELRRRKRMRVPFGEGGRDSGCRDGRRLAKRAMGENVL